MPDDREIEWRRRTAEAFEARPLGAEYTHTRTFFLAAAAAFIGMTGDFNPLHQDAGYGTR